MSEAHNNAFIALMLAQMIGGSMDDPYRPDDPKKSKFYTEPGPPKTHNHPEPKEHTHGTEPKPRPKRKIWREEKKNPRLPDESR